MVTALYDLGKYNMAAADLEAKYVNRPFEKYLRWFELVCYLHPHALVFNRGQARAWC
jgi:hypothetical protein